MEEKKIDKGSIFGFIIIGLILVWMLYNNQNIPKTEDDKLLKEVSTDQPTIKGTSTIDTTEVVDISVDTLATPPVKGTLLNIENDLVALKVNTKGGQIAELRLKLFKSYKGDTIHLIKDNNADFNLRLITQDGRLIQTRQLIFQPELTKNGNNSILTLTANISSNQQITFRYLLRPDDYLIDFDIRSQGIRLNTTSSNIPKIEWKMKGIRHAKSVQYENRYTMLTYRNEDGEVSELSAASDDEEIEQQVQWVSFRQHFFNSILVTDSVFETSEFISKNLIEEEGENIKYTKDYVAALSLDTNGGELQEQLHWYYGPTDYNILKTYEKYHLSESLYLGWGIFGWLNKYIFIPLFEFLSNLVPHGIAIILLTILVRLVMSPATYKSYLSQAKMKVLQPEIGEINKKFSGKEKAAKRQQEMMSLYRKAGVNPMSGCIPALLQLPVFYALFTFFPTAFELRQKSFLWADDLSSYDTVFLLPFKLPFYGEHVSLFPILASVAIFIYMMMTTGQTMQQQQQPGMPNMKFMMYLSPLIMLFVFNNYASGLSLYYFISNLITILIMLVIKKFIIDQDKIHAKIQENKKKPKKMNRFQRKMQDMMEQAEAQKKKKQ